MRTRALLVVSIASLLAATFGFAQLQSIRANVPFQFVVETKAMPAGQYNFVRAENDEAIQVTAVGGKAQSVTALIVTRLGTEIHTTPQDAHIVFDKVGDTYFLSELWIPGLDGFLLHATKGKHEHKTVTVPTPK